VWLHGITLLIDVRRPQNVRRNRRTDLNASGFPRTRIPALTCDDAPFEHEHEAQKCARAFLITQRSQVQILPPLPVS
jgi:hypothetical protein